MEKASISIEASDIQMHKHLIVFVNVRYYGLRTYYIFLVVVVSALCIVYSVCSYFILILILYTYAGATRLVRQQIRLELQDQYQ